MNRRIAQGFTVVDLLAMIIIIGVLMALLVTGCSRSYEHRRQVQCTVNQHVIAMAFRAYDADLNVLPGFRNSGGTTWVPPVFPYLGRVDLYELWTKSGLAAVSSTKLECLICPSNPPDAQEPADVLSYVVNCGRADAAYNDDENPRKASDGIFVDKSTKNSKGVNRQPSVRLTDIKDGAAYTLLLGESLWTGSWGAGNPGPADSTLKYKGSGARVVPELDAQSKPQANKDSTGKFLVGVGFVWLPPPPGCDYPVTYHLSSRHGGGAVVAFCDGHTRFLRDNIDYLTYCHLMTPDSAAAGIPGTLSDEDY